jgi:ABC-type sugar transport system substrate-binding protein
MSTPDDGRAAALSILAAAWSDRGFRRARSFCVGFDAPEAMIAAMERGYRPAVRRDLMGEGAAAVFIARWDAAAEALGVASRAHVCMPKGAPPAGDGEPDAS